MAKKKTQDTKERSTIRTFIDHQGTALEEAGRAITSLLPKDFRTHSGNAVKEGREGFRVLFNGVIDEVERGLDKLRQPPDEDVARSSSKQPRSKKKVKVEVEDEDTDA
jgi:hypothetical protein